MPTIFIENKPYEIQENGRNLLDVCLSLGFNLPYFCWHPAMHSVGACRQCAVKIYRDEKDTKGWITMACMTEAKDGTRISVHDPEAATFRARVSEWLMLNHPHDCPVCDESGECHLQDMTVMTGHTYRRYRFKKRTYRNQDLGPFVNHEMNRCIQCYRCVRFYRDYAGGRDFHVFGWHDHIYFGRHEKGALQSEFSGNLVEVCPTGVFTDKTFREHYTRKWDLQTAPSICAHCGLGCNTIPGERYGMLRRIHARFNAEINGYFLCDRGRYGYEFVNSPKRLRGAFSKATEGVWKPETRENALPMASEFLSKGNAIGIGSPRASVEANFTLRALVGADRFFAGIRQRDLDLLKRVVGALRSGSVLGASLHEIEESDAVLILGEDPTNSAPMLDLALRQAAIQKPKETARKLGIPAWHDGAVREVVQLERGPFFIATPDEIKLDSEAAATYRASPNDISRLGFAIAHELDSRSPAVTNLNEDALKLAVQISESLKRARRPTVVSGVSLGSEAIVQAAAQVAQALRKLNPEARVFFVVPECNSIGLALMADKGLDAMAAGSAETLLILENDLYRRMDADRLFQQAKHIIALDHSSSTTTEKAGLVLPAATFAEQTGTLVNNEGRAQRFFQVFVPAEPIQASWRWLSELKGKLDGLGEPPWKKLDEVIASIETELPDFKGIAGVAPAADFRGVGKPIPRQSHRHSGRTAITANVDVHEPRPVEDVDAPLAFSMEGFEGQPPPALMPRVWAPGWNSVQAIHKFQIELGSGLHRFAPGLRLIQPSPEPSALGAAIPAAFGSQSGEFLVVAVTHIFGSEELSAHTSSVSELSPKPYVGLNPNDAASLGVLEGWTVSLTLENKSFALPVRIRASLAAGLAVVPVGMGPWSGMDLPAAGRIEGIRS
jgi:NADH-quinone oxidoreductase subunit G